MQIASQPPTTPASSRAYPAISGVVNPWVRALVLNSRRRLFHKLHSTSPACCCSEFGLYRYITRRWFLCILLSFSILLLCFLPSSFFILPPAY
ncbi:hypothetical protein P167DRAFT_14758 [Morchella conica CCBAS932]|uniref:Uncharacterized protein n=1 Tax=Morchella conica CCBAS932 TaxID=1392247 RepID=A0A3N4L7S8_9PEZI|nr:hypothetical protein P167DRAFT_14758 [Morchella conica CCBAS932]